MRPNTLRQSLLFCLLPIVLSACFHHQRSYVPVQSAVAARRGWHIVRQGDTLYSIAWQHNLDYRALAATNHIRSPYLLKRGQRLRLRGKPYVHKKKHIRKITYRKRHVPHKKHHKVRRKRHPRVSKVRRAHKAATIRRWFWPTVGKVVQTFSLAKGHKGITIVGKAGQVVRATASGRVAYAGEGIRGYGKLLIIKHNSLYLSAYAHNRRILVHEGKWVKAGQVIAQMGSSGARRVKLHFEIRRAGRPVNPLQFLTKH